MGVTKLMKRVLTVLLGAILLFCSPPAIAGSCDPLVALLDVSPQLPKRSPTFASQNKEMLWKALATQMAEGCQDGSYFCAPANATKRVKKQARRLSRQNKTGLKLAKQLQKELGASGLITYSFVVRNGRGTVLLTVLNLPTGKPLASVFFANPPYGESWEDLVRLVLPSARGAYCEV